MSSARPAPHNSAPTKPARFAGRLRVFIFILPVFLFAPGAWASSRPTSFRQSVPTPLEREVERQRARLSSPDAEERRDALMRLGSMARPEASRAAAAALGDTAAIVRATAARAVLSLPPGEAATLVLPLLADRDEFVRRETAYALGLTRSPVGVAALLNALESDKEASVRGAAAVALGQIGDASAWPSLAGALSRRPAARGAEGRRAPRRRAEQDEFVRRAAAISLGQLRSREAVPALIEALSNERELDDVRREAARALGLIGDASAAPALRAALASRDPHLARIAFEALRIKE